MNKSILSSFTSRMKNDIHKYSPQILMGIGIAGMITTTLLAVKATPKALDAVRYEGRQRVADGYIDQYELIPAKDIIKLTWKYYIPSVALGSLSIVCLIGSNSVSTRRTAILATAYKISENALVDYKEKVIETIGEKKENIVREKVSEEKLRKNPIVDKEIILTNKGDTLCYDAWSGLYFKSDIEVIRKAENKLNRRMMMDMSGYISLNELYSELNLDSTEMGRMLGWSIDDGLLKINLDSKLTSDDRPCLVIDYDIPPKYDYSKLGY